MAVKVVHVSDLSGKEAAEEELGRLVIHQHPGYADLPVTLEVLPEEVDGITSATQFATVEWIPPGARTGERLVVDAEEFDRLAGGQGMGPVIGRAIIAKHDAGARARPVGRQRGRGGGPGRVNYASLEHAGEPHRGRTTEAEKQLVREHLDEVNQRLAAKGLRPIDPDDAELRRRYGL